MRRKLQVEGLGEVTTSEPPPKWEYFGGGAQCVPLVGVAYEQNCVKKL